MWWAPDGTCGGLLMGRMVCKNSTFVGKKCVSEISHVSRKIVTVQSSQ